MGGQFLLEAGKVVDFDEPDLGFRDSQDRDVVLVYENF
jgi:hypothetical protein